MSARSAPEASFARLRRPAPFTANVFTTSCAGGVTRTRQVNVVSAAVRRPDEATESDATSAPASVRTS